LFFRPAYQSVGKWGIKNAKETGLARVPRVKFHGSWFRHLAWGLRVLFTTAPEIVFGTKANRGGEECAQKIAKRWGREVNWQSGVGDEGWTEKGGGVIEGFEGNISS